jgi:hypothetical protein
MSEPSVPPAPKKGMSTGVKVLLGCLLAALLVGLGTCAACYWGVKKLGQKAEDYVQKVKDDPDAAVYDAFLWTLKANPDVEVVASDDAAKTITIREKSTGKETTLTIEDIREGRISFEQDGKVTTMDFEAQGEAGAVTIQSGEDKAVFGAGGAESIPGWIPSYPGARVEGVNSFEAGGEKSGTFVLKTADDIATVAAFFEEQMGSLGLQVDKASMNVQGAETVNLTGRAEGRTLNVTVSHQEGETQGIVAYTEKS